MAIAVVGEHGTGKTHLVNYLINRCAAAEPGPVGYQYLSAQAGDFRKLYFKNFLDKVDKPRVLRRLNEYYGQIVAASFGGSEFPEEIRERLRSNKIDPQRFVRQFGLPESIYLEELHSEIYKVTKDAELSTALTLMLREDLSDHVWGWLCGDPPDELLKERGILITISTESAALKAIGMFSRLFRGQDRFVLVIDEMEKVLSQQSIPTREVLDAFRELVQVTTRSGILLVLAGLPEFVDILGGNTIDRMQVVHTTPFTAGQVEDYVKANIVGTGHRSPLGPFHPKALTYMTALTNGNIRHIVGLCRKCYELTSEGGEITHATVKRAAQDRFEIINTSALAELIRDELAGISIPFVENHQLAGSDVTVDYWIPVGTGGSGCAIFLTDSVLTDEDATRLADRAKAVTDASPGSRTLLIVNGFLPESGAKVLRDAFTSGPLVYVRDGFLAVFGNTVNSIVQQVQAAELDPETGIRLHVERLTSMHIGTQRYVEALATQIEELRRSSEMGIAALSQQLHEPEAETAGILPSAIEPVFVATLSELRELTDLRQLLSTAFDPDDDSDIVHTLLVRERSALLEPLGVLFMAEALVLAFQDAVTNWYILPDTPPSTRLYTLRRLCRMFENISGYLPYYVLDGIRVTRSRSQSSEELAKLPTRVRALVGGLGSRVEVAALSTLGAPG
ncbi:hypothetical protein [Acrocarpospora pleiomorpha]|uniref:hypothetical protein n=1 Tax=Acrocarpospora pleiomorpha TaxID=90975 RepID=UPI0012D33791|nr:hypothetical protein [Acrocarpospora pleiomorpha]